MRCRQCDYALWDLPSRKCPECGTPFKPGEYEFQPGAVQFLCPHCRQCYYGTDATGHLRPRSFTCVKCNQPIEMDEMLLVPAEGWAEDETSAEKLPWLNRKKIGLVKGFFKTAWMAMTTPSRVMKLVPAREQASGRLWFAILTNFFVAVVSFVPFMVFPLIMFGGFGGGVPTRMFFFGGVIAFFVAVTIVGPLIAIVMWSLATHAALRLTGRIHGTFDDTFSVFCYSAGANMASAFPCIGQYFGWIWWIISAILMVRERHKVHGGRATLAVGMWPVLLIAVIIAIQVLFTSSTTMTGMAATTMPAGAAATWQPNAQGVMMPGGYGASMNDSPGESAEAQTEAMQSALAEWAQRHNDRYPKHALILAVDEYVSALDFTAVGTPTDARNVQIDSTTTLRKFATLSTSGQAAILDRIIRAMPRDVVAHRIGDYVLTYHGIEAVENPAGLWVVIRHVPTTPRSSYAVYVATADGQIQSYSQREFLSRLQQQNALRARRNLPPLPHPDLLTLDEPVFPGRGDGENTAPSPQ